MPIGSDRALAAEIRRFAGWCAVVTGAIGASALLGWALGLSWLAGGGVGSPAMPVDSAAVACLLALALLLLSRQATAGTTDPRGPRADIDGLVLLAATVCLWTLVTSGGGPPPSAARMPGGHAASFLLAAGSVAALARPRWVGLAQTLGAILLIVAHLVLSGHLVRVVGVAPTPAQPLSSGLTLGFLGVGVILARSELGWASMLSDGGDRGRRMRTLLLPVLALPPLGLAGVLWGVGEPVSEATFQDTRGFALLSTALAVTLAIVVIGRVRPPTAAEASMERRRAELRDARERVGVVFGAALDSIVMIDQAGRLLDCNPAAERTFGWSRADLVGREIGDFLIPPRHREAHVRGLARYLASGESRILDRRIEMPALRSDGSEIPVELTISPSATREGIVFVAYLRDISERLLAEEKLNRSVEEKDVLLREVHHRVKNNLQMISSLLGLQARRAHDPEVERAFQEAIGRIRSISILHESLYARGTIARFEIAEYLRAVTEAASVSMGGAPSSVEIAIRNVPPGGSLDAVVPCGIIVTELVTNAFKYARGARTPGPIRLTVEGLSSGDRRIVVEDGGPGLPQGIESGPTLGAQIVSLLARQLGGTVDWGRSEELGGARVEVRFPKEGPS